MVTTSITELPESRVRVDAEVPAQEVERRIASAARALGRDLRVPGFRAGKAPAAVVIKRVGREAVVDEAVRSSIGTWYSAAIDATAIVPIGEPELDMGELPGPGEPVKFSFEIGVRPTAQLGEYKGLEVGRREAAVSDEAVAEEIEGVRERTGRLETVQRAAAEGDFVVIDYEGSVAGESIASGSGRDEMVELGSGRLVPGFEQQLIGAAAGDERTVTIDFPDDYSAHELAGETADFAVMVRDVRAKELPAIDDELASQDGYDTLQEMREDIRRRLAESDGQRIEAEFREAVLDSAVANATVEVSEQLTRARSRELFDQLTHQLSHQGINKQAYLEITGLSEEEVIAEGAADAERQIRREAVLAAIVEAERIEPTDDDVRAALRDAARPDTNSSEIDKLFAQMRSSGRLAAFKSDLATRRALDVLCDAAVAISVEQAKAREKLWTPGEEKAAGGGELWTPGS